MLSLLMVPIPMMSILVPSAVLFVLFMVSMEFIFDQQWIRRVLFVEMEVLNVIVIMSTANGMRGHCVIGMLIGRGH